MKAKKKEARKAPAAGAPPPRWPYVAGLAVALLALIQAYHPALHGPFLFDDSYLPMNIPDLADLPLRFWLAGVRPLLMFSYWVNYQMSGHSTFGYHMVNLLIHFCNAALVGLVFRKLAGPGLAPLFAAAIFLLHPVQSESVAYIAGRSESLSGLFFLAAFVLFLYRRRPEVSWAVAAGVLALFAAALASKEHVVVLPALLLLTDYFFNPGLSLEGARRNWRIYAPMILGALAGTALVLRRIGSSGGSAGLTVAGVTWRDYLFTQFRVFFRYLRLFVFPAGQNIDYDFPLSRSLAEHGAILGLIGLVALLGAAFFFRRRFPLACYGMLVFFLLLAPTSSILPIKDPIAERRLYLPLIGLLLVVVDGVARLRVPRKSLLAGMAILTAAAGAATFERSQVWNGPVALWEDTVAKAPGNARAHFQLGYAYFTQSRCQQALEHYETAARLEKPDGRLLIDWGLAFDCLGKADEALDKFRQAAALENSAHAWSLIGLIHGRKGQAAEAWQALDKAVALDPRFDMSYVYRGHLFLAVNDRAAAEREYTKAYRINPNNVLAREALERLAGAASPAPAR